MHYVYYGRSRSKDLHCKNQYLREEELIRWLIEIIGQMDVNETDIRKRFDEEMQRIGKFNKVFLGQKKSAQQEIAFDPRSYATYVLNEGTLTEKRELLGMLKNKLMVVNKCIKISDIKISDLTYFIRFFYTIYMSAETPPSKEEKSAEAGLKQRENLGRALKLLGEHSLSADPILMKSFLAFTPEQSDAAVEKLEGVLKDAKNEHDRETDREHWLSWIENPQNVEVKLGGEQEAGQPKLSGEERIKQLEGEGKAKQQEIARLTQSIEGTKAKLNEVREKLGLPPIEEDTPSVFSEKNILEKLRAEQEALTKQKEGLVSEQEKDRLIREEKENILQEKLDELFEEFEALTPREFASVLGGGRTTEGRNFESLSMGELDPEVAQSLARAFKEGMKLLPKILEVLPGLLKKFDEDLTREATERVENKLKEEKEKIEEREPGEKPAEEKPEGKPTAPEGAIPPSEIKPESNPATSNNTGSPKV